MIIKPGTDPETAANIRKSISSMTQKIDDFLVIAQNIDSANPQRDAWKAVFGYDNPAFDENTKEGNEMYQYIQRMYGRDIDAQEAINE